MTRRTTENFYADLDGFEEFSGITDLSLYRPLPEDWCIVTADIRGSTKAIKEGRYKDVNMMGAACIAAVINAVPECSLPYVFGGDGATLAAPLSKTAVIREALAASRQLSLQQFGLELRAGIVPLADIKKAGASVLVAKLRLSPGNAMAMFSGGGVQMVDGLIKAGGDDGPYAIPLPEKETTPDLEGLSCRWEPLKSCRGVMMSMLIYAMADDDDEKAKIYRHVIDGVAGILKSGLSNSPVSADNMIFKWPSEGIRKESKLYARSNKRWIRILRLYITSFIQFILEKFDLSAAGYNAPQYRQQLRANTDFRRFDDMLRMILDCPKDKADEIEAFFEQLHDQGKLAFGTHRSDHALMTCLVFSLTKGEHIHFIDGSDGGFAVAAIQLKAQLQSAPAQV